MHVTKKHYFLLLLGIQCAPLPSIDDGDVSQPSTAYVDTVATYACNDGYNVTDGSSARTCLQSGSSGYWGGSQPRCACE